MSNKTNQRSSRKKKKRRDYGRYIQKMIMAIGLIIGLPLLIPLISIMAIGGLPTILLHLYAKKQLAHRNLDERQVNQRFMNISVIGLIMVNIFFIANGVSLILDYYKYTHPPYEQEGIIVTGEIIRTQRRTPKSQAEDYRIEFILDGEAFIASEGSTRDSVPFNEYGTGDKVELITLPQDPQRYAVFKAELEQRAMQLHHSSWLKWESWLLFLFTVLVLINIERRKRQFPIISSEQT